jgi:uncharacterized phage protein (TIGR02216 family)
MSRFDFPGLLRVGVGLGLTPRDVWQLTPAELAFLLGRSGGDAPLGRARLEELAAAFPDKTKDV